MDDPQTPLQIWHTVWLTATTVAGAIVAFFTKRLVDQVDSKADQCEVDDLKRDLREFIATQAEQHRGNTDRLDRILLEVSRRPR